MKFDNVMKNEEQHGIQQCINGMGGEISAN